MLHILNRQGIEELARLFYGFFTQFGQPFGLHLYAAFKQVANQAAVVCGLASLIQAR